MALRRNEYTDKQTMNELGREIKDADKQLLQSEKKLELRHTRAHDRIP